MEDETELKGLKEHSEEVEAVMGQTPSWVFRWGITAIGIIIMIILIATWHMRWPDTMTVRGKLMIQGTDTCWQMNVPLSAIEVRKLKAGMEAHVTLDNKDESWGYYTATITSLPLHSDSTGYFPVNFSIHDLTTDQGNVEQAYLDKERHTDVWQLDATAIINLHNKRLLLRLLGR